MRLLGQDTCVGDVDISRASGTILVMPNGQRAKVRTFVVVRDLGPEHSLGVFNNNIRTVERALCERYLMCQTSIGFEPPLFVRPRTYLNNSVLQIFRQSVVRACLGAPIVSLPTVVAAYVGAKRARYQAALESLAKLPLSVRDAFLTSFVKFEKQDLRKAPRIINPRSYRYNLVLGKYLKFLEKHVYRAINETFNSCTAHTVIKGLNARDVGAIALQKWERFVDPVAVGLDATKFDMHTSVPALKFEHSFYTSIFPRSPELRRILSWQLTNKGVAYCDDGRVKFKIQGTRSSGDLNTSLGNCIIMCSLIYAYSKEVGVEVELMNNGDDCQVIMERKDLNRYCSRVEKWFEVYGYRMQVEPPAYEFEQLEFCQARPVIVDGAPIMVRNVRACLRKDPMCLVPVQSVQVLGYWLRAVGECGLSITKGVPILQSFYNLFYRSGRDYSEGFLRELVKNTSHMERNGGVLSAEVRAISASTRASFFYAFGVSPAHQIALESVFDGMSIDDDIELMLHEEAAVDKGRSCAPPLVEWM